MNTDKRIHLKIPTTMLVVLHPTGCRGSKEAEASWLLGAAIDVAREMKPTGRLPILGLSVLDDKSPVDLHIPLSVENTSFLTEASKAEGGSRGQMAREFIMTARKAAEKQSGCLTHEGLAEEIKKLFL